MLIWISHLKFTPGIEFLETVHCLLPVYDRRHAFSLLKIKKLMLYVAIYFIRVNKLTQIHGCLRASAAVILLPGLTVNIWFMRFFASGVTVSHSGLGY